MTGPMEGQASLFDQDIQCGRMSPERSAATTDMTFSPYWKNLSISPSQKLMFLDLRKSKENSDGKNPVSSPETGIPSRGGCMTCSTSAFLRDAEEFVSLSITEGKLRPTFSWNTSEAPNHPIESKLSWILEDADPKYNLSPLACQGILRRAAKRGKALPEMLKKALERRAKE